MDFARRLLPLSLTLAGLAAVPAAASAAPATCAYDAVTRTFTVNSPAGEWGTNVGRDGESIVLRRWTAPIDCTGGDATVTNTDTIELTGAGTDSLELDLSGGPLAPGFSPEEGGDPEIEVEVDVGGYYAYLIITGAAGEDTWRAGTINGLSHVNLNPGEAVPDSDVVVRRHQTLSLRPGGGDDTIDARGGAGTGGVLEQDLTAFGSGGNDTVYGGQSGQMASLYGNAGHDKLYAGTHSFMIGDSGNDTIVGGPGDDYVRPSTGNDTVSGLDAGGNDTIEFEWNSPGVQYDMQVTGPQATGEGTDTIGPGLENVDGTEGPDVFRGTGGPEHLGGDQGDDVLEGRGGDDVLWGGPGTDAADYGGAAGPVTVSLLKTLAQPTGGAGNDKLSLVENVFGSAHADTLTGDTGPNHIDGAGGADVVDGRMGTDLLDGGYGIDKVTYSGRAKAVAIRLDGLRNDGADPDGDGFSEPGEENDRVMGFENATGGSGPDRLFAPGSGVNLLAGRGGDDYLDARDGSGAADFLSCGNGTDTYRADPADTKQYCETEAP